MPLMGASRPSMEHGSEHHFLSAIASSQIRAKEIASRGQLECFADPFQNISGHAIF